MNLHTEPLKEPIPVEVTEEDTTDAIKEALSPHGYHVTPDFDGVSSYYFVDRGYHGMPGDSHFYDTEREAWLAALRHATFTEAPA